MKRYIQSTTRPNVVPLTITTVKDWEHFILDGPIFNNVKYEFDIPDDNLLYELYKHPYYSGSLLNYVKTYGTVRSFKEIKSRLSEIISSYDSEYFRAPKDLVNEIATIISDNASVAPYPISIKVKPTSVFIYFKLSKKDIQNLDPAVYDETIGDYIEFLESFPEIGDVLNGASYLKISYYLNLHENPASNLAIKVLPAVRR